MDNWTVQLVFCVVQRVSYNVQMYTFISDVLLQVSVVKIHLHAVH